MRKLRLLGMAVVLAFTLAVPAFAGITNTPPAPEPPPPDSQSATGIIPTLPQSEAAPTDTTIEFALSILQSLLATF